MEAQPLFGIPNFDSYAVITILVVFSVLEIIFGYLKDSKRKFGDWIQEAGSFFILSLLIKPGIVIAVIALGKWGLPNAENYLQEWSLWLTFPLFLLVDDVLQYGYHRWAHSSPFLWKLHRPHHQAEEMGFLVSYRNASLYYLIMPNIWWLALFTFLGGGIPVAIGLIAKQLVIIGSHSSIKWDTFFYRFKILRPVIFVLERIFITPAFHHAHHGKSRRDGISDPNANFGNMFSIWDQLFGTAVYTRQFPTEYGLENDPKDKWSAGLFYPVIASDKEQSEIARGYQKVDTTTAEPTKVDLKAGEKYLWCQCGKSNNQPFCDGSHHGTKHKPLLFEVKRSGSFRLCNCKLTQKGPFCDNSHLKIAPK